jgi:DNA helicase-2/ATP-dependent DNA helicase PcrA
MPWDDGLVGAAKSIAATNNTPLRVMAGPGTGKSFAMKRRVARLLDAGQKPQRILAVTFTRNAAASLVDDLHALGVPGCEDIRAGTLHAYCFGLLIQQVVFEYLGRVARPIITFLKSGVLQFEGGTMLEDLIIAGNFGPKRDCTKRIRAFEAAWARLQSDEPGWPHDPVDRAFQTALVNWLKFHNAMLIGELVVEALRFLRNNPNCDARKAFDHVIVDEYQDLNRAEQDLIQLLSSKAVAIVGDIDQSIYSFRHANPEGHSNI